MRKQPRRSKGNDEGGHKSRFVETERRCVALTHHGRELYYSVLNALRERGSAADNDEHQAHQAQ
ncbi:2-oxoadipate dioxygenase/decarboxylase family protein [Billgrantia desiderata]|uniref:2-oxoadipate dioxygenase/decarboxylase family protein n=1 Tax=Billgrantia desiderata TaxID=52021 RepID=UPI0035305104